MVVPLQIVMNSPKAILYNDRSVLENHHVSATYQLLQQPKYNIFDKFSKQSRLDIRKVIISTVLATDMGEHSNQLGSFEAKIDPEKPANERLDISNPTDRLIFLNIVMKASDINNPARVMTLAEQWTTCVTEEFFQQGDTERRYGVPISDLMDRENPNIPKSQVGFIQFVVNPLFAALNNFCSSELDVCIQSLTSNLTTWQLRKQQEESQTQASGIEKG